MIYLIDNYDSFVWNLGQYLHELGKEVRVVRNDARTADEVLAADPWAIVLSPGPGMPSDTGICMPLIRQAGARTPILGICLGHQAIGHVYGAAIVRSPIPVHGKRSKIFHRGDRLLQSLPSPFMATRYHSIIIERRSLPSALTLTAETEDGIVMGVSHTTLPVHGLQFHPESYASEHGHAILRNFLAIADEWNRTHRTHSPRSTTHSPRSNQARRTRSQDG